MKKNTNEIITEKEVPIITLSDSVNEYNQLCSNLENEIVDLDVALELVLLKNSDKLAVCDKPFKAAETTTEIVNINRRLQKSISTLYNLRINLGI